MAPLVEPTREGRFNWEFVDCACGHGGSCETKLFRTLAGPAAAPRALSKKIETFVDRRRRLPTLQGGEARSWLTRTTTERETTWSWRST